MTHYHIAAVLSVVLMLVALPKFLKLRKVSMGTGEMTSRDMFILICCAAASGYAALYSVLYYSTQQI